jgi:hypothetical protein
MHAPEQQLPFLDALRPEVRLHSKLLRYARLGMRPKFLPVSASKDVKYSLHKDQQLPFPRFRRRGKAFHRGGTLSMWRQSELLGKTRAKAVRH